MILDTIKNLSFGSLDEAKFKKQKSRLKAGLNLFVFSISLGFSSKGITKQVFSRIG
jgi:hypothetical protein